MRDHEEITDIIWSPYTDGHHPMYLRVLLESMATTKARKVIIAVGSEIVHDVRWQLLSEMILKVDGQVIFLNFEGKEYPCNSLLGQLKQRNLLVTLLSKCKCNRLYIPFCDSIWFSLYLLGIPSGSCNSLWLLWMRNQSHLPLNFSKKLVEWMKIISATSFTRKYNAVNYTVDPCFYTWSTQNTSSRETYQYIPEPVLTLCNCDVTVPPKLTNNSAITILAIGVLDERKDFGKLIDAFVGLQPGRALLRLVGTLSESCLQRIAGLPPVVKDRIFIYNSVVTDEVYSSEMHAASIIWNVRSTHLLSSGTLAHAIANHKVVICSTEGCSGYWGRKYKRAVLCLDNPVEALNSALIVAEQTTGKDENDVEDLLLPFTRTWAGYL